MNPRLSFVPPTRMRHTAPAGSPVCCSRSLSPLTTMTGLPSCSFDRADGSPMKRLQARRTSSGNGSSRCRASQTGRKSLFEELLEPLERRWRWCSRRYARVSTISSRAPVVVRA